MSNSNIILPQYAHYITADMDTPISLFMSLAKKYGQVAPKNQVDLGFTTPSSSPYSQGILLESTEVDGRWGRYSLLAFDMALIVHCRAGKLHLEIKNSYLESLIDLEGQDFVPALRELMKRIELTAPSNMEDLPPITRAFYGYLGFGMAGLFNPKLIAEENESSEENKNETPSNKMSINEAECRLVLPNTVLLFDHLYNRLAHITLDKDDKGERFLSTETVTDSPNMAKFMENDSTHKLVHKCTVTLEDIRCNPSKEEHLERILKVKEMLRQGEGIQTVLSVNFSVPFFADTFNLYRKLRRYNASPYMFYMGFEEKALFGASPELLVRCNQNKLYLSPIAGTRKRGQNEDEDALLADELLNDPKEQAEHVMLVDLGRNDLGKIAKAGSVNVEQYMQVERFSHVMHLTSHISADIQEGLDALDVLASTFPAGTVSGAPKIRAMEMIRELEGRERGIYAGCIGWIGLDKDTVNLDMGITIRSMWHENNTLYWQAGGGIVHDSVPELEWEEIMNKSAIIRKILQDDI